MEFKDLVKNRYSCRKYKPEPVSADQMAELLEIARYSASGMNLQPWKIKVVSDPATKEKISGFAHNQAHVRDCSHLLVLCADTDYETLSVEVMKAFAPPPPPDGPPSGNAEATRPKLPFVELDKMEPAARLRMSQGNVYIMLGNILNGAASLGLASCAIGAFATEELSSLLELPSTVVPTILVTVGYPDDEPKPMVRRPLEDTLI